MPMIPRGSRLATLCALFGACASCSRVVAPPAPLSVVIYPSSVASNIGETLFLKATVTDSSDAVIVPDSVRWSSSDTTKATVSQTGVLQTIRVTPVVTIHVVAFKGRAQGSATIPVAIVSYGEAQKR